jgi:hypothetical protein
MRIYLLNYSDDRHAHKGGKFRNNQLAHNAAARNCGIDEIVSWTWDDLRKTPFYSEHTEYLNRNRYHNGAVFKPFIVLDLLERIEPGSVVLYYDCNPYPLERPIQPLVNLCLRNQGRLFHQYGDRNRNWTKRDAFVFMNCDTPRFHNAVALQNTWFLMENNQANQEFVREWLHYNLDERIASYVKPDVCGKPPLRGFYENRGDQSIFSNLAVKYHIKSFFGVGGTRNRNINDFIDSIPKNHTQKLKRLCRQLLIKWRRRRLLMTASRDQIVGVIPAEMREG